VTKKPNWGYFSQEIYHLYTNGFYCIIKTTTEIYKIPQIILLLESSRQYSRGFLIGIGKYARFNGP
jgi:hypothetical protein